MTGKVIECVITYMDAVDVFECVQVVGEIGGQDDSVVVQDGTVGCFPHTRLQLTRQVKATQTHQQRGDVFILMGREGIFSSSDLQIHTHSLTTEKF